MAGLERLLDPTQNGRRGSGSLTMNLSDFDKIVNNYIAIEFDNHSKERMQERFFTRYYISNLLTNCRPTEVEMRWQKHADITYKAVYNDLLLYGKMKLTLVFTYNSRNKHILVKTVYRNSK